MSRVIERHKKPIKYRRAVAGALALIIVTLLGYFIWNILGAPPLNAKNDVSRYLSQKYNKPFVIETVNKVGAGLGDPTHLVANAHPVDNANLHFHIVGDSQNQFDDTYLSSLWSAEVGPKINQQVANMINNPAITVQSSILGVSTTFNKRLQGTPSFEEAQAKSNHEIGLNIGLTDSRSFDDTTRAQAINYLYNVTQHYAVNAAFSTDLGYVAWTARQADGYQRQYSCNIPHDKISTLHSPSDLMNCFSMGKARKVTGQ